MAQEKRLDRQRCPGVPVRRVPIRLRERPRNRVLEAAALDEPELGERAASSFLGKRIEPAGRREEASERGTEVGFVGSIEDAIGDAAAQRFTEHAAPPLPLEDHRRGQGRHERSDAALEIGIPPIDAARDLLLVHAPADVAAIRIRKPRIDVGAGCGREIEREPPLAERIDHGVKAWPRPRERMVIGRTAPRMTPSPRDRKHAREMRADQPSERGRTRTLDITQRARVGDGLPRTHEQLVREPSRIAVEQMVPARAGQDPIGAPRACRLVERDLRGAERPHERRRVDSITNKPDVTSAGLGRNPDDLAAEGLLERFEVRAIVSIAREVEGDGDDGHTARGFERQREQTGGVDAAAREHRDARGTFDRARDGSNDGVAEHGVRLPMNIETPGQPPYVGVHARGDVAVHRAIRTKRRLLQEERRKAIRVELRSDVDERRKARARLVRSATRECEARLHPQSPPVISAP
jgi:hypothetical protein